MIVLINSILFVNLEDIMYSNIKANMYKATEAVIDNLTMVLLCLIDLFVFIEALE